MPRRRGHRADGRCRVPGRHRAWARTFDDGEHGAAGLGDRTPDPGRDRRLRDRPGQGGGRDDRTGGRTERRSRRGQGRPAHPCSAGRAEPTLFELSHPGRQRLVVPDHRASPRSRSTSWSPKATAATSRSPLAEVSERDLVAHFTRLSHRQFSVDLGAYPLGSCTMKYNPKVCDTVAGLPGLAGVHPAAPASLTQGWLGLLVELEETLCEITGMAAATLQPAAGAAGELTGLLLMRAWHEAQGSDRHKVIIPDSAHGTNPASVTLGGYEVVTVPSDDRGCVDMAALAAGARRGRGRHHADQSEHPRPVRGGHRRHRRRRPRGRWAPLLRRGQSQRHPRRGAPRRHGIRHRAHEPPQDLRHAPRWGRARGRARWPSPSGWSPSCPAPGRCGSESDDQAPVVRVGHPPRSIGRVHTWHGNTLVLARALAYILANGGDGLRQHRRDRRAQRQLDPSAADRHLRRALRPSLHARGGAVGPAPSSRPTASGPSTWPSGCSRRGSTPRPSTSR